MVYIALDDTLSMELVKAFIELWLKMQGKHVVITGSGHVNQKTGGSMRVVARMGWLHLIGNHG